MRNFFLMSIAFISSLQIFAQKPAIDTSLLGKWPYVYGGKLSDDGKYATYTIKEPQGESQVFLSTRKDWKKIFVHSAGGDILSNNKYAVLRTEGDSLYLLQLGTDHKDFIGNAASYALLKNKGNNEWLVYQEADGDKRFVLRETDTGQIKSAINVKNYLFNENSGILLLQIEGRSEQDGQQLLSCWNLLTGEKKIIWKGANPGNFVFDETGSQIAFLTEEQHGNTIWYYKIGMEQAEKRVGDAMEGIDTAMLITNEPLGYNKPLVFSSDGKTLFFQLQEKPLRPAEPGAI